MPVSGWMTELEAVNIMLSVINEAPVNSLSDAGLVDVALARNFLAETSRQVQAQGWEFNVDTGIKLPLRHPDHHIILPGDTLSVDTWGPDSHINVTQRARKLYNKDERTFVFDKPPALEIVRGQEFEDLPYAAQYAITSIAGRRLQARIQGNETLDIFQLKDVKDAWANLKLEEGRNADYNLMRDNWSVNRILDRRGRGLLRS